MNPTAPRAIATGFLPAPRRTSGPRGLSWKSDQEKPRTWAGRGLKYDRTHPDQQSHAQSSPSLAGLVPEGTMNATAGCRSPAPPAPSTWQAAPAPGAKWPRTPPAVVAVIDAGGDRRQAAPRRRRPRSHAAGDCLLTVRDARRRSCPRAGSLTALPARSMAENEPLQRAHLIDAAAPPATAADAQRRWRRSKPHAILQSRAAGTLRDARCAISPPSIEAASSPENANAMVGPEHDALDPGRGRQRPDGERGGARRAPTIRDQVNKRGIASSF